MSQDLLHQSTSIDLEDVSALTFALTSTEQARGKQMIYVVNLEDGGGQEFFLAPDGNLIGLSEPGSQQPQQFKTYKLVSKKMDQLRPKYPPTCRIYAVEKVEFDQRRLALQQPGKDQES